MDDVTDDEDGVSVFVGGTGETSLVCGGRLDGEVEGGAGGEFGTKVGTTVTGLGDMGNEFGSMGFLKMSGGGPEAIVVDAVAAMAEGEVVIDELRSIEVVPLRFGEAMAGI